MTLLIKDRAQARRAAAPTKLGLHPYVAEILQGLGVDAQAFAHDVTARARAAPDRRTPTERRAQRVALAGRAASGGGARGLVLSLDPGDVRVTPLLNQAALLWEEQDYVADLVAPPQLTAERSAKYKIWARGGFRRLLDSRVGPNGSAKEVEATLSEDEYAVQGRALKAYASDDTELANPTIGAGVAAVDQVMEQHAVNREYDVATLYHTTGSYASGNVRALGGGANWNGGASAAAVADMLYCIEKVRGRVTDCVVSDTCWHGIQQNDEIRGILASQLANAGLLRPQDFSLYFGIPNVRIVKADYETDAGVRTRLWSTSGIWLGAVDTRPDRRTFCRTFRLRQGAGGYVTKRWRDEDRGENGGMWVRTAYAEARKIVSNDYAALITGAVT